MPTAKTNQNDLGEIIKRVSVLTAVPEGLIKKVVGQESGGNRYATSRKGARGLMQLMPGTARDLGVTDTTDAFQNVLGGAKYLRQMLDKYGNTNDALAAYNWGPGHFDNYLAGGRKGDMPMETQNYINQISGGQPASVGADANWGGALPGLTPIPSLGDLAKIGDQLGLEDTRQPVRSYRAATKRNEQELRDALMQYRNQAGKRDVLDYAIPGLSGLGLIIDALSGNQDRIQSALASIPGVVEATKSRREERQKGARQNFQDIADLVQMVNQNQGNLYQADLGAIESRNQNKMAGVNAEVGRLGAIRSGEQFKITSGQKDQELELLRKQVNAVLKGSQVSADDKVQAVLDKVDQDVRTEFQKSIDYLGENNGSDEDYQKLWGRITARKIALIAQGLRITPEAAAELVTSGQMPARTGRINRGDIRSQIRTGAFGGQRQLAPGDITGPQIPDALLNPPTASAAVPDLSGITSGPSGTSIDLGQLIKWLIQRRSGAMAKEQEAYFKANPPRGK